MYEQKLCNATKLYEQLRNCKREIDAKEMELLRYVCCVDLPCLSKHLMIYSHAVKEL